MPEYDEYGNVKPSTDYPMHHKHPTPKPCVPGQTCPFYDDISGIRRAIAKHESRLNSNDTSNALLKQQVEYIVTTINGLKATVERVTWVIVIAVISAVIGLVVVTPKLTSVLPAAHP